MGIGVATVGLAVCVLLGLVRLQRPVGRDVVAAVGLGTLIDVDVGILLLVDLGIDVCVGKKPPVAVAELFDVLVAAWPTPTPALLDAVAAPVVMALLDVLPLKPEFPLVAVAAPPAPPMAVAVGLFEAVAPAADAKTSPPPVSASASPPSESLSAS